MSSCNSGDGMGQRVQSLMFMMMMVIPFLPFFSHDQQQIFCSVHGSKIVNYHNAVAEDVPFIWQKIERDLT